MHNLLNPLHFPFHLFSSLSPLCNIHIPIKAQLPTTPISPLNKGILHYIWLVAFGFLPQLGFTQTSHAPSSYLLLRHRRTRTRRCIPHCSHHHRVDEDEVCWKRRKARKLLAWPCNSADVISRFSRSITNAMVGPRAWVGGILSRSGLGRYSSDRFSDYTLTPLQEERLKKLQERLNIPFDETCREHQEALRTLWYSAFPDVPLQGLVSEQWKDMGWQGLNPSTDFRGCGFISLENLLFFARKYPVSFHRLLYKQGGERSMWEYPFAVAGINVSFMLIQMLDLLSAKPKCRSGFNFVKLLGEDNEVFDVLYCIAFAMMDAQWLAMRASYMEFNDVLRITRTQLERELSLEDVNRIQDLPAYNLLYN